MITGSLAYKSAVGSVALGATVAIGFGIWKLNSQSKEDNESALDLQSAKSHSKNRVGDLKFPEGYRWLDTDGNKDDAHWKIRLKGTSSLKHKEEQEGIKELKKICSEIKNEEFEQEIPYQNKSKALGWCGWNDAENNRSVFSNVT